MTNIEIAVAAVEIITSSSSEDEVQRRIRDELGYPHGIVLVIYLSSGSADRKEWEYDGGLVMKNGELVSGMMHGHDHEIIDL